MADWSTYLTAGLSGGMVTGALTFAQFLRDNRRHKGEEKRAEAAEDREERAEPLRERAAEYGLVDQATLILRRAIKTLEGQVKDLEEQYSTLKRESDEEIKRLTAENRSMRDQVTGLYRTIGEMEDELRGYRRRGVQGA